MTLDMLNRLKHLNEEEKKSLLKFEKRVKEALTANLAMLEVFGSKVRGDFTSESDIDILVVVKKFEPAVAEKMAEISSDISIEDGVLVSPVILSKEEYGKNRHSNTLFVQEVDRDGILIYGAA
ncbi:MAG: nucleotidyltransferase domain-containing protein [Deltaproteobacteria bacterium]|nr:nucleotidyltransferase domain-containing protein [Deltaproteobacteria bacterium]